MELVEMLGIMWTRSGVSRHLYLFEERLNNENLTAIIRTYNRLQATKNITNLFKRKSLFNGMPFVTPKNGAAPQVPSWVLPGMPF
jgi:hypothetical protein